MCLLHHNNGNLVTSRISFEVAESGSALHVNLRDNASSPRRSYPTGNASKSSVVGEHGIGAIDVVIGDSLEGKHEEGGDFHRLVLLTELI